MSTQRRNRSSLRNRRRPNYTLAPANDVAYISNLHGVSMEEASEEAEERLESFAGIAPGSFVKLDFIPRAKDTPSESMWVEIIKRSGSRMVGRLLNQPLVVNGRFGDRINLDMVNIRHLERP